MSVGTPQDNARWLYRNKSKPRSLEVLVKPLFSLMALAINPIRDNWANLYDTETEVRGQTCHRAAIKVFQV